MGVLTDDAVAGRWRAACRGLRSGMREEIAGEVIPLILTGSGMQHGVSA